MAEFQIENGVLVSYNGPGGHVVVPEGVRKIGKDAFCHCRFLRSVVFPEGVEEIAMFAFSSCGSLHSIAFPTTLRKIGRSSFLFCERLKEIVLPEGVAEIEEDAFRYCGLEEVRLPSTMRTIGKGAFCCHRLRKIWCAARIPECPQDVFGAGGYDWIENYIEWVDVGSELWLYKRERKKQVKPVEKPTQEEQEALDEEYLSSVSHYDMAPYPLDPRAREIIHRRNGR